MEEVSKYEQELSAEEQELFRILTKNKKANNTRKYNKTLTTAMKNVLDLEVMTLNGVTCTVAEKIAIAVAKEVMENPSVDKVLGLTKITGEYSEKQEVTVSNLDSIIEACKGDKF